MILRVRPFCLWSRVAEHCPAWIINTLHVQLKIIQHNTTQFLCSTRASIRWTLRWQSLMISPRTKTNRGRGWHTGKGVPTTIHDLRRACVFNPIPYMRLQLRVVHRCNIASTFVSSLLNLCWGKETEPYYTCARKG